MSQPLDELAANELSGSDDSGNTLSEMNKSSKDSATISTTIP